MLVVTGTLTPDMPVGQRYNVQKKIEHKEYCTPLERRNDIALLRTKEDIQFSDLVKPIPIRMKPVIGHESALTSGWGLTHPWSYADTLQYVEVVTLNDEECRDKHDPEDVQYLYEGSLSAFKDSKRGVCTGDSGGPLAINGELVGLVSWGVPCAKGYPDVYTRVSTFNDWIMDSMANSNE